MRHALATFFRGLPEYVTYEAATRAFVVLVLMPMGAFTTALLVSGRAGGAVTNATIWPFLASWQGVTFVLLAVALLAWLVVVELGGAIVIAARRRAGQPPARYLSVVGHNLRRAPNLLSAGGPLVLLYVAVVAPLTGAGFTPTMFAGVGVPMFVMSVIAATPALLAAYVGVIAALSLVALTMIYTVPLIILGNLRAWPAIVASVQLVLRRPGVLWRRYLWPLVGAVALAGAIATLWFLGVALALELGVDQPWQGPLLVFLLGIQQTVTLLFSLVALPYQAHCLVDAYHTALPGTGPLAHLAEGELEVASRRPDSLVTRALTQPGRLALGLVGAYALALGAISVPGYAVLGEVVGELTEPEVIAHRAGGNGAPENSLAGLEYAIEQRADRVEIDVQRTADGAYVLNHDDTFARVAGEPRASGQLTLAEVKALTIAGSGARVPTLEEFLTAAKGRMPVLIELKGATADQRMGDDVVAIVDRLGMRGSVTLMSLNYPLVQYIEGTYPAMTTGFAYFWSIGDVSLLTADVIMLEEGEATPDRVLAITAAGKQAYVWTVNDPETVVTVAEAGASGVITDTIPEARSVLDRREDMTPVDLLAHLLGFGTPEH
ncbi:glycerophosphodiester phosphodiesterase family protein [Propioniciclava sp.]|uniref:glycerophosphodiester phosphodiesterase family protein n=1 Tax=Propioniciclava sp. TaxID=2038686 RepID=UPI00261D2380|nr:glycerophosphodiester phosphodiesterase family protein [Propioniciclava sp.]